MSALCPSNGSNITSTRTLELNRSHLLQTSSVSLLLAASQSLSLFRFPSGCVWIKTFNSRSSGLHSLLLLCLFTQNYILPANLFCSLEPLAYGAIGRLGLRMETQGQRFISLHVPALPVLTSLRTDFCSYCHIPFLLSLATKVKLSLCVACRHTGVADA